MTELLHEGVVHREPAHPLRYLMDGGRAYHDEGAAEHIVQDGPLGAGGVRKRTGAGTCDVASWDKGGGDRMKCNICGTNMRAVTYNSDGYGERLVVLDDFNPSSGRYEMAGRVMYCPNCGNLQVKSRKAARL